VLRNNIRGKRRLLRMSKGKIKRLMLPVMKKKRRRKKMMIN
jgi:hypothetical protein